CRLFSSNYLNSIGKLLQDRSLRFPPLIGPSVDLRRHQRVLASFWQFLLDRLIVERVLGRGSCPGEARQQPPRLAPAPVRVERLWLGQFGWILPCLMIDVTLKQFT